MPMSLVAILAPKRVALVTMGQSVVVVGGGLLLLPAFGVVGMAQAVCAMRVAIALVLLGLAHRIDRRAAPRQGLSPATGAGAS
jgi:hypothetical protein